MNHTDRVLLCLMWAVSAFLGYAMSYAMHRHLETRKIEAELQRAKIEAWPRHLETMLDLLRLTQPKEREIGSAYYARLRDTTERALRNARQEEDNPGLRSPDGTGLHA